MSDPARLAPAPSPTPSQDRRGSPRVQALREGRLMLPDGLGPEVLILDISASGALVRLRGSETLPQDLVLVDRKTFMAHRAVIARRRDLDLGLKFLRSQSLAGSVPAPLAAAKAWCELRPRTAPAPF